MTEIIHIVGGFPGPDNAVADYAWKACRKMRSRGIRSQLLCHPCGADAVFNPAALTVFEEDGRRSPFVIGQANRERIAVFHYNGFSYSRNGAPGVFVEGLLRHRHQIAPRLISVFHELWVEFVPWRRTAWYQPSQRSCVRRLLEGSELAICTTQWARERLGALMPSARILKIPVFSNVGELDRTPDKHPGLAVLFGASRRRVYRFLVREPQVLGWLGVERIIDIGPALPIEKPPLSVPVDAAGVLSETLVSQWLAKASIGFIAYPTRHIAKSGSAAALTAHGVCLVNIDPDTATADGLQEGVHFLGLQSVRKPVAEGVVRDVGSAGFQWYQPHALSRTVDALVQTIDPSVSTAMLSGIPV